MNTIRAAFLTRCQALRKQLNEVKVSHLLDLEQLENQLLEMHSKKLNLQEQTALNLAVQAS